MNAIQQRQKQEQTGQWGTEGTRGQIQAAYIGDVGDLRLHRNRALVVGAAGETREALLSEQNGEGVDADGVTSGSEFALHVIDGEIAFAHSHRQITDAIAGGRGLRAALRLTEEGSPLLGIVAELMAEDPEGAWGIREAAGDVGGGLLLDEVSSEGLVLALHGELRREEEVLIARCRYLLCSAELHISMVLQQH